MWNRLVYAGGDSLTNMPVESIVAAGLTRRHITGVAVTSLTAVAAVARSHPVPARHADTWSVHDASGDGNSIRIACTTADAGITTRVASDSAG